MKFFLIDLVKYMIFCAVFYIGFVVACGTLKNGIVGNLSYRQGGGHALTRLQEAERTHNIDILFLGSSHTYRGFDPRIFSDHGYSTFNLGTSSQTPIQTEMLLDEYLLQFSPKIVVFEAYPVILAMDGVESSLSIIANSSNGIPSCMLAIESKNVRVLNTLIFALYKQFFFSADKNKEDARIRNDIYVKGGYVERPADVTHSVPLSTFVDQRIDIQSSQTKALINIINKVEASGARMVLVQSPVKKAYYESFLNMKQYSATLASYAEYYDFNLLIDLDDNSHYFDHHHLNQIGVNLFNEKLIEVLNL
jgi:hypothetical protein